MSCKVVKELLDRKWRGKDNKALTRTWWSTLVTISGLGGGGLCRIFYQDTLRTVTWLICLTLSSVLYSSLNDGKSPDSTPGREWSEVLLMDPWNLVLTMLDIFVIYVREPLLQ